MQEFLLLCLYMKRTNDDKPKTQQQEIANLKETYLRFFSEFPVQKAAADFIGRDVTTVQGWARDDAKFQADVSRAKAEWAKKASRRVRPDNLLANLYDETKPPKQEIEQTVTDSRELQLLRQLVNPDAEPQQPLPPEQPAD